MPAVISTRFALHSTPEELIEHIEQLLTITRGAPGEHKIRYSVNHETLDAPSTFVFNVEYAHRHHADSLLEVLIAWVRAHADDEWTIGISERENGHNLKNYFKIPGGNFMSVTTTQEHP